MIGAYTGEHRDRQDEDRHDLHLEHAISREVRPGQNELSLAGQFGLSAGFLRCLDRLGGITGHQMTDCRH